MPGGSFLWRIPLELLFSCSCFLFGMRNFVQLLHSSWGVFTGFRSLSSLLSSQSGGQIPPFHWKGQSLYSQGLFLEAALGWAGIGHLPGSLPFPNLIWGCPARGPRELQLRVTASEPLSQVGHCAFFRLKSSLRPRGAVLFALGKSDFFPFISPTAGFGIAASQLLPLVTKGQCDSGSLKLQNQSYLGKLSGVLFFRTLSHLCCL